MDNIFTVLKSADEGEVKILETPIPTNLRESDVSKIIESYTKFMETNPESSTTSVLDKYNNKGYESIYGIYHDIKVASSSLITQHKIGTKPYKDVDFFYKFSTEILMRESSLYKVALVTFNDDKPSELEELITADFDKVSFDYNNNNGEVISYISEIQDPNASNIPSYSYGNSTPPPPQVVKQPLFTSLIGKSELDPRFTLVPEPYNLVKAIPLPKNTGTNGSTFDSLNTVVSKIPMPTNQPTTMLDNFIHLNWYIINAPEWLNYKGSVLKPPIRSSLLKNQNNDEYKLISMGNESAKSFAPTIDSKGSGVSTAIKSNIWLNQVGLQKIKEIRNKYNEKVNRLEKSDEPEVKTDETNDKKEDSINNNKSVNGSDPVKEETPQVEYDESKIIDFEKLMKWDPKDIEQLKLLKDDKDSIIKSPKDLQKLITNQILKLNRLRQERYLKSNANSTIPVTNVERKLYNKITKLITLAINLYKIEPGNLPLEFSKKVPVLMSEYPGTLPGMPASRQKPVRLPTIRGPYKKKNRY